MKLLTTARSVWLHQFDQLAEQSMAEIASTMRTYAGSTVLLVKAVDGQTWMGHFDKSTLSIDSSESWHARVAQGAAAGITVLPWVVPNVPGDATGVAALGTTLVVDAEPKESTNFWQGSASDFAEYLLALRQDGVTELYVSIDPRQWALDALGVAQWAHLCDALMPQLYWTDFQQSIQTVFTFNQQCLTFGVPVIPVLPYDATAADLATFWGWCSASPTPAPSPSLWKMGPATAAQLSAFGALALPAPTPAPQPTPDPLEARVAALEAKMASVEAKMAAIGKAAGG